MKLGKMMLPPESLPHFSLEERDVKEPQVKKQETTHPVYKNVSKVGLLEESGLHE